MVPLFSHSFHSKFMFHVSTTYVSLYTFKELQPSNNTVVTMIGCFHVVYFLSVLHIHATLFVICACSKPDLVPRTGNLGDSDRPSVLGSETIGDSRCGDGGGDPWSVLRRWCCTPPTSLPKV